jgi:hypothetical protein
VLVTLAFIIADFAWSSGRRSDPDPDAAGCSSAARAGLVSRLPAGVVWLSGRVVCTLLKDLLGR